VWIAIATQFQHWIVTQCRSIIAVRTTKRNSVDALAYLFKVLMTHLARLPGVSKYLAQRLGQLQLPITRRKGQLFQEMPDG
jgi:hypothetical protein